MKSCCVELMVTLANEAIWCLSIGRGFVPQPRAIGRPFRNKVAFSSLGNERFWVHARKPITVHINFFASVFSRLTNKIALQDFIVCQGRRHAGLPIKVMWLGAIHPGSALPYRGPQIDRLLSVEKQKTPRNILYLDPIPGPLMKLEIIYWHSWNQHPFKARALCYIYIYKKMLAVHLILCIFIDFRVPRVEGAAITELKTRDLRDYTFQKSFLKSWQSIFVILIGP